jgi:hypothetical protein
MTPFQTSIVELWRPSVERLTKLAVDTAGVSVINSGIVEEGDKIFQYGLCCESSLVGESDVTFSLGVTCLHLDPEAATTVRATVGWYRSMLDLESVRHPGFAIYLRETPYFAFSESDSISPLGRWIAQLEREMKRAILRGRPPGRYEVATRKLLGISRGRQELPLMG